MGLQKVGDLQIFSFFVAVDAFFAFKAFTLASALEGAGASLFAFGAIFVKRPC